MNIERRMAPPIILIVSAMALSACLTSQEKKQREEAFERLKADQVARIEQAEQAEEEQKKKKKEADEAALRDWVNSNEPYVRGLCDSDSGAEHQFAWLTYRVAVSTDPKHVAEAEKFRRPIINCEELRLHKPAGLAEHLP